jgi:hypothetical protein
MNKLLQVIADKELNRAILADPEDKANFSMVCLLQIYRYRRPGGVRRYGPAC